MRHLLTHAPQRLAHRFQKRTHPQDGIAQGLAAQLNPVLLLQDARGERLDGIIVQHGYSGLRDDRTHIHIFGDEVNCAARQLDACLQRLRLWAGRHAASECWEQRGMRRRVNGHYAV